MSERTMARTVSCAGSCGFMDDPPPMPESNSPAAVVALVLFAEPPHERLEVFDDRGSIHLTGSRKLLERVLPGLAAPERKHVLVRAPRFLAGEDRALVQRAFEARLLAKRALELELQDEGQEVARVRRIAGDVVLRCRIEVR